MKAINQREHELLLAAIKRIAMMGNCQELVPLLDSEERNLIAHFQEYRSLLAELSVCITAYEAIHHRLKVEVLGPALRKARKQNMLLGSSNVPLL